MIIHENIEQGSPEWLKLRCGKITASRVGDLLKNGRGGKPSATAETYLMQLATELLLGKPTDTFVSDAMKWGTETEPQARAMYELMSGNEVKEVAFFECNEYVGMSPDGLVGDDGLLEIKCPATHTQVKRFLTNCGLPKEYEAQVQFQLWVSDRQWCDFVSFDPRIDGDASYICTRVERDNEFINNMSEKVMQAIEKLAQYKQKLGIK